MRLSLDQSARERMAKDQLLSQRTDKIMAGEQVKVMTDYA